MMHKIAEMACKTFAKIYVNGSFSLELDVDSDVYPHAGVRQVDHVSLYLYLHIEHLSQYQIPYFCLGDSRSVNLGIQGSIAS